VWRWLSAFRLGFGSFLSWLSVYRPWTSPTLPRVSPPQPLRPVRVLPRPAPPRWRWVVSVRLSRWFRVGCSCRRFFASSVRFGSFDLVRGALGCPHSLTILLSLSARTLLSFRGFCLPFIQSAPPAVLPVSLAVLPTPPSFRLPPLLPLPTLGRCGYLLGVSFVFRSAPRIKRGLIVNIYCNNYIISKYQNQSFFFKKYQKVFEGFKACVYRASRCLSCPVSVGVSSYVYAVAVFLPYYAKFKGVGHFSAFSRSVQSRGFCCVLWVSCDLPHPLPLASSLWVSFPASPRVSPAILSASSVAVSSLLCLCIWVNITPVYWSFCIVFYNLHK